MTPGSRVLTNSAMVAARTCLRKYQIAYVQGIRPIETAQPLRFGSAMHDALEHRLLSMRPQQDLELLPEPVAPDDPFDAARVRALMAGYRARWTMDAELYDVIEVEVEFRHPLRCPSGAGSTKWKVGGKIDFIVCERSSGRVLLGEHKTTSDDMRAGSDYWLRVRMDSQMSIYVSGAASLGHHIDGILYDVIGKPTIRPLLATPIDARKVKRDGTLYANQRDQDETPADFEARLLESIAEDPNRYYQRAEVVRLESEIDASHRDVWEYSRILSAAHYPRNMDSCMKWGRACPYLPACSGAGSLDDETRYQRLTHVHPELRGEIE